MKTETKAQPKVKYHDEHWAQAKGVPITVNEDGQCRGMDIVALVVVEDPHAMIMAGDKMRQIGKAMLRTKQWKEPE
jgi:hypothetical protein